MGSNIIELAKLGHERAAELKASCGAVDVRSLAQLISDLATQLEVQFVRSTNMAVQLANAESKCRELAAESSNKSRCLGFFASVIKSGEEWTSVCEHEYSEAFKTPATDAFLAEVRVQGVEELASLAGNECKRYKSVNDRAGVRKWKSIVILCSDFAAQLRKGVQS
ncbi:TPA: hypothetical protein ACYSLO_002902 [Salmonella enterica]